MLMRILISRPYIVPSVGSLWRKSMQNQQLSGDGGLIETLNTLETFEGLNSGISTAGWAMLLLLCDGGDIWLRASNRLAAESERRVDDVIHELTEEYRGEIYGCAERCQERGLIRRDMGGHWVLTQKGRIIDLIGRLMRWMRGEGGE
jgi:hypothetical protein